VPAAVAAAFVEQRQQGRDDMRASVHAYAHEETISQQAQTVHILQTQLQVQRSLYKQLAKQPTTQSASPTAQPDGAVDPTGRDVTMRAPTASEGPLAAHGAHTRQGRRQGA
jgi:hypothetical protein